MTDELVTEMLRAYNDVLCRQPDDSRDAVAAMTAALAKVDEMYHLIPKDSEPVAYLYSHPKDGFYTYPGQHSASEGWTETPLYAPEKRHDR